MGKETPKLEWSETDELAFKHLTGRAYASLDEHSESMMLKARQSVMKRLAKMDISSAREIYDETAVKRFLLMFSDCVTPYKECAKRVGISLPDLHAAFTLWPEGKMVKDYLVQVKKELTRVSDVDDLKAARETIREAMKGGDFDGDAKAAMFVVSKLDRDQFGDDKAAANANGGKAQVVYNLPGLTVNMISAPKDMTIKLEQPTPAKQIVNI